MRRLLPLTCTSLLLALAPLAATAPRPADGTLSLEVSPSPGPISAGTMATFTATGTPGNFLLFMVDLEQGPSQLPFLGGIDIDLAQGPFFNTLFRVIGPDGTVSVQCVAECDDVAILGQKVFVQAVSLNRATRDICTSNVSCVTWENDGVCDPEPNCLVIMDEDTLDEDMRDVIFFADQNGVTPDVLINEDRPTTGANPPLRWNELGVGDIALIPGGQVNDEGIFALPEDPPFSIADYVAGTVPQDQLDEIRDVMPLRDQELYNLIGRTCTALVYDSDISSVNFEPLQASLQGERLGLFTFTVLAVEVPICLPSAGSSSSLYSLWVRVEEPVVPTESYTVPLFDHAPDSIQAHTYTYDGTTLTVEGESQFSDARMTLSIDGPDGGCDRAVEPFLLEQEMTPIGGNRWRYTLDTNVDLTGRRLKLSTDRGGADNVNIESN